MVEFTPGVDHSPLGGSGAGRWIPCPGSVGLSRGVHDLESEYATEGTAGHLLGETCLNTNVDAWEHLGGLADTEVGELIEIKGQAVMPRLAEGGVVCEDWPLMAPVSRDMVDAVQIYLDAIRAFFPDRDQGNSWVEREFYCPSIHKYMWGKSDWVYVDFANRKLHVWDYKHGAGIVVDVKNNFQLMYYAVGILEDLNLWGHVDTVEMGIIQPRGFHFDGAIRRWSATVDYLDEWQAEILVPAMDRALTSTDVQAGEHCRFCPARANACPAILDAHARLKELIDMIDLTDASKGANALTNEQVGEFLDLAAILKIASAAAEKTAFARLQAGKEIPSEHHGEWRLGYKRSNRTFKEGAQEKAVALFGDKALTMPILKSPAKIDELPGGVEFTATEAFKPDTGLTVKKGTDSSRKVSKDTKSLFKPVGKGDKK